VSRPSVAGLVFRMLLRLFPSWFREEHGREMADDFERHRGRARREAGRIGSWRFVLSAWGAVVPEAIRVRARSARRGSTVAGLGDDLILAARALRRSPGWTGAALLILTLGIGGTASVFSVLDAVLLRPLPYAEPDDLVSLWTVDLTRDMRDGSSWENGEDWKARSTALNDVTFILRPEFTTYTVVGFDQPVRMHVGVVSRNFFELLGVDPVLGRTFLPEDLDGDQRIAVIDEALWTDRYARSAEVLGRTLDIGGVASRIVGVVPSTLDLPRAETHVWQLLDVRPPEGRDSRGSDAYWVVGRLAEHGSLEAASAELEAVAARLAVEYPDRNRDRGVRIRSLRSEIVGDTIPLLLWTLLGSTALVLLVGGTNVAQLMLSRGIERRRELAIRASLGASRARVNRQLLFESALLSGAAGLGGVLLARLGLAGLLRLVPPDVPLVESVRIDVDVWLVCFLVAGVLAPLIGSIPALSAGRQDPTSVLRSGGRGSTVGDRRLRSLLVVGEMAMAVVLLTAAGLLVRSLASIRAIDPGFDARATLIARVDLSPAEGSDPYARVRDILSDVRSRAGVRSAGAIGRLFVDRFPDQRIRIVGDPPAPPDVPGPRLTTDWVMPSFFESMDVRLLRGRHLGPSDVTDMSTVSTVVVNRRWVETFSPDRDPLGLGFRWGDATEGEPITVVGVVEDVRRTALEERPYPQMFAAGMGTSFDLLVTTSLDPLEIAPAVRASVSGHDASGVVSDLGTVWERYDVGLAPRDFQALMFGLFAALATILAAVGLFAVLHDSVASRRREFGIRLALGAEPAGIYRIVLVHGVRLAAAGLVLGMVGSFALSGLLGRLVYDVSTSDPTTLAGVVGTLLVVSAVASAVPAVRATRVMPAESLTGDG